MKKLMRWGWVGLGAVVVVLAGCGGSGSSSSTASLRVVNATLTHPSLDLLVNSAVAVSGVASDAISDYLVPASGALTLQLNDAGAGTALTEGVSTLSAGGHYTLFAYESGNSVKTVVLGEDQAAPAVNAAQLRIYDVAPDAGKLDVYITDPGVDLANASSPVSFTSGTVPFSNGYATYSPGTYRVRVTAYGNKNDLRLDIPSVTLTSQQVGTIVLSPASGGVLLNGSVLMQQQGYTAFRNTNVRVRLAAAVSGGATVAASAGSTTIDAGSVAPAFGFYTLVPASSPLNINLTSSAFSGSVGAPATALVAGSDMTLLVYGTPTTAVATLITDDNRLPSDGTSVKMRLINGVTGNVGALTLTANASPVGINVAPGAASSYVSLPPNANGIDLVLISSSAGTIPMTKGTALNSNTVYSVLAGGDVTAPQLLIR